MSSPFPSLLYPQLPLHSLPPPRRIPCSPARRRRRRGGGTGTLGIPPLLFAGAAGCSSATARWRRSSPSRPLEPLPTRQKSAPLRRRRLDPRRVELQVRGGWGSRRRVAKEQGPRAAGTPAPTSLPRGARGPAMAPSRGRRRAALRRGGATAWASGGRAARGGHTAMKARCQVVGSSFLSWRLPSTGAKTRRRWRRRRDGTRVFVGGRLLVFVVLLASAPPCSLRHGRAVLLDEEPSDSARHLLLASPLLHGRRARHEELRRIPYSFLCSLGARRVRTGSGGGGGARQGRGEVRRGGRSSIGRWRARIRRRWPLASSSPSSAPSIANGVHHWRWLYFLPPRKCGGSRWERGTWWGCERDRGASLSLRI
jgi:hypothetical protein